MSSGLRPHHPLHMPQDESLQRHMVPIPEVPRLNGVSGGMSQKALPRNAISHSVLRVATDSSSLLYQICELDHRRNCRKLYLRRLLYRQCLHRPLCAGVKSVATPQAVVNGFPGLEEAPGIRLGKWEIPGWEAGGELWIKKHGYFLIEIPQNSVLAAFLKEIPGFKRKMTLFFDRNY